MVMHLRLEDYPKSDRFEVGEGGRRSVHICVQFVPLRILDIDEVEFIGAFVEIDLKVD